LQHKAREVLRIEIIPPELPDSTGEEVSEGQEIREAPRPEQAAGDLNPAETPVQFPVTEAEAAEAADMPAEAAEAADVGAWEVAAAHRISEQISAPARPFRELGRQQGMQQTKTTPVKEQHPRMAAW
jgi:hypothetical protein